MHGISVLFGRVLDGSVDHRDKKCRSYEQLGFKTDQMFLHFKINWCKNHKHFKHKPLTMMHKDRNYVIISLRFIFCEFNIRDCI